MKITLITVGKIKEKYLRDAIAEYSKRLSRYCKLEIVEVADEKTPDQASETVEENIRAKEGERILKYIKDDMYVITLEIGGKMLSSEEFAGKIESLGVQGKSSIAFVIGGSIGLGKEVLRRSDYALSFSKMTFPHQLMRVILLEQVYRGYRIINGEPYHKYSFCRYHYCSRNCPLLQATHLNIFGKAVENTDDFQQDYDIICVRNKMTR